VLNGASRPGDDEYTCSIVAINPDNGKLAWGFVVSPHDTHDWDAVENAGPGGWRLSRAPTQDAYAVVTQRILLRARPHQWKKACSRFPSAPSIGIRASMRRAGLSLIRRRKPAPDGRLIAPDEGGPDKFSRSQLRSKERLFIVDAHPSYSIYFAKARRRRLWMAGA